MEIIGTRETCSHKYSMYSFEFDLNYETFFNLNLSMAEFPFAH